jgi:hypothetical protein
MPTTADGKVLQRARAHAREGKSPGTLAGAFVRDPDPSKSNTRDALMNVLLVLNSLILLFSHWTWPRK